MSGRCDFTDTATGMTHREIIDDLQESIAEAAQTVLACVKRLAKIADIIDVVEQRCAAADGPVTPTLQEMTEAEIREIYKLARGNR